MQKLVCDAFHVEIVTADDLQPSNSLKVNRRSNTVLISRSSAERRRTMLVTRCHNRPLLAADRQMFGRQFGKQLMHKRDRFFDLIGLNQDQITGHHPS